MGIPFLPFGFGDCQTLLLQGSCFGLFWSCVIRLFKPFFVVGVVVLCLSYVFCIGSGLLLLQDPCLFS